MYFYYLYLTSVGQRTIFEQLIGVMAFIPQVILLVCYTVKYYKDIPFCIFLQTLTFVAFNKVCTVQYFVWYFSLLPLVLPHSTLKLWQGFSMILVWFAAQVGSITDFIFIHAGTVALLCFPVGIHGKKHILFYMDCRFILLLHQHLDSDYVYTQPQTYSNRQRKEKAIAQECSTHEVVVHSATVAANYSRMICMLCDCIYNMEINI